ncbi:MULTISPECIES: FprA family A-type flavoprotein [unclassified Methanoregula]|uniref:FprA family A-type flavoprotein n=1 Tax=unclassified Methanoregula TaxID=2649730 RepID=UPI0009CFA0A5|nr:MULTISPECIES: FprA family A-type flavoprotein [unclassified Methanoregula]OPX64918.1 MAG: Type A flavoprotein FprA [Methanoregula sp. PtaB.Bin085]OPY32970.1 MAG: Type A flavoprotein FprA [Methanoregula sp. PtaU1.Bin006]
MVSREIVPGVLWVGALDFDRRIFDELIPLPSGTSYNAYLIRGSEKTALIDTVDPTKEYDLISNLVKLGIERIDYIIINHAEQDHAGSLPMVLEFFPDARVVTNEKCRDLLIALLHLTEDRFMIIKDRETLPLGDRTLEFILTPWTHWPETQVTYLREDRILFPCDLFGHHTATTDLFVTEKSEFYVPAKRYFAEIMMPFRSSIKGHLEKIRPLKIDLIAPSHGPIHKKPQLILDSYAEWVSDAVKNEVVIPYVSMHGSTQKMVDHFTDALMARGVTVKPFNLTRTDIGELAIALVDAATVVIATPTVLFGPHPQVIYATYLANLLKPKTRYASVIGSFGWGGKAPETIVKMLDHLKVEVLEPVMVKGLPDEQTLAALDRLADEIARKHKENNIV